MYDWSLCCTAQIGTILYINYNLKIKVKYNLKISVEHIHRFLSDSGQLKTIQRPNKKAKLRNSRYLHEPRPPPESPLLTHTYH